MPQENPYRIFVTHAWQEDEDYLRVFEFLEESPQFFYRNVANPSLSPPANTEHEREALRAQIGQCEVVLALAGQYARHAATLDFELVFARAIKRPVILMRSFGVREPLPRTLTEQVLEILDWDGRAMVAAIKRHSRGEGGPAWDVVEFNPD